MTVGGSMAEYAVTRLEDVIFLPDDATLEQGVALFVNPMTALGMIHRCKQLKAKAVVITAAASQLGRMLIKLCKKEGMHPICVVRRDEQVELLKTQSQYVFNSTAPDYK